jgi:hypothetical protein
MQSARVLAVFESAARAEGAVNDLRRGGFDATCLSVIGKDENMFSRLGAVLPGVAVVSIPRGGRVVALGPITGRPGANQPQAAWSVRCSALAAMLMRVGMSAGAARTYEAALRGGQIVVLVHGPAKDVLKARRLLRVDQAKAQQACTSFAG